MYRHARWQDCAEALRLQDVEHAVGGHMSWRPRKGPG
jgi:hypothetical protein